MPGLLVVLVAMVGSELPAVTSGHGPGCCMTWDGLPCRARWLVLVLGASLPAGLMGLMGLMPDA